MKSYLTAEFNPIEAGLQRFVDMDKNFKGKAGLLAQLEKGLKRRRVLLEVDSTRATCQPGESIYVNGKVVGSITSSAWGFRRQQNLAMAYIDAAVLEETGLFSVRLLGDVANARISQAGLKSGQVQSQQPDPS
ncbi:MAG: dimethylglycine dehydrogenase [Planctomycetota bacterium]|jgi:dimethylglycine dehydrogenase